MPTTTYHTNLNCGKCVAAVKPLLDAAPKIERWSVDTADPRKLLTIEGRGVTRAHVEQLVRQGGFKVLGELTDPAAAAATTQPAAASPSGWITYYPLLLILLFLLGGTALLQIRAGTWHWPRLMGDFMGGFFVIFAFFKLLNLRGFADAFATYDVLAIRLPAYAWLYPFLELGLGVAYLLNAFPLATNLLTLAIMLLGIVGVVLALREKRAIQCACLGTVFNLPMSKVTLFEDALMAGMALVMLAEHAW